MQLPTLYPYLKNKDLQYCFVILLSISTFIEINTLEKHQNLT